MSTVANSELTLIQQHAELEREVADWRTWWRELSDFGQPRFGEMGDRLAGFRERLSRHFQEEEFRGPLAGRSGDSVAALWRDHALLLADLDRMVERLQACGPDVGCWSGARTDFESFLDRLHAHEGREAELVESLR